MNAACGPGVGAAGGGTLPATGGGLLWLALALVLAGVALRVAGPRRALAAAAAVAVIVLGAPMAGAQTRGCPPAAPAQSLAFATTTLKEAGGEPNVSVSPSGRTILVDGLSLNVSPADLWRSTDGGKTFTHLKPTFTATGGSDFDMRFIDDTHVIAADLSLRSGIYIHRSADAGDHWETTNIQFDVYDRPWLDHFGADKVYVVAKGFDGVPYLFRSSDGGKTFATPILLYGTGNGGPDPVTGVATNQNAYVDHLYVDQRTGDVFVLYGIDAPDAIGGSPPVGAANHLYVAHLEGDTMVSSPVHLGGSDENYLGGFNWLTGDRAGTLYALGNGRIKGHWSTRLSYSKDKGKTWSPLVDVGPGGAANVYGSIAGGDPGVLSMVYLRGSAEDPSVAQNWYVEMARIAGSDTATPSVERVRPVAAAMHTKDICFSGILCGVPGFGNDRNLLDYIWNAIAPDGTAFAVITSDGPATDSKSTDGGDISPDVMVLRQTGGARHGAGVQS